MLSRHLTFACLTTYFLFSATASAAEKTITAKVTSVDAAKNSIKLDDLELDVSRKTKITVDGKKATLDDIKKGQQVKVIYDDGLEAAISIIVGKEGDEEATATAMKALQGEWKCIAAIEGKKAFDKKAIKDWDRRATVKGSNFTMTRTHDGERGSYTGKFEIDASNGHFDWVGKGPGGKFVEWIGIYELDGDDLKVAYRFKMNEAVQRPKNFKDEAIFYTFKRETD